MKKTLLYSLAVLASVTLASCNGDYDDWLILRPIHRRPQLPNTELLSQQVLKLKVACQTMTVLSISSQSIHQMQMLQVSHSKT